MLQFRLKHLVAIITLAAIYFGVLSGTARLLGVGTPFTYSMWATDIFRWPLYIVWAVAALVIFEHRTTAPTSAKCALAALIGFGCLSLINVILQLRMMAKIQTPGAGSGPGTIWMTWYIIHPFLSAACWALLLFALVQAMRRPDNGNSPTD
jgi:hypothetical protein